MSRLLSPDTRSGLLVAIGTALLLGPFAIGLSMAAIVTGVVLGVLIVGLGLAGTAPGGRATLSVSALPTYDQGTALGLILTGGAFALIDETNALALFAGLGIIQLLVTLTTRYTARPGDPNFL